MGNIFSF